MNIPVVVGTSRKGNKSQHAANFIVSVMKEAGVESELVLPSDHVTSPVTARVGKEMDGPSKWQEIVTKAQALILVIPEYNRSYPGELKLLIDQLYPEYKHKPFGLVGVSSGMSGGARAVEAMALVVLGVEGIPLKPKLFFPNVHELFDESGKIASEELQEKYKERVLRHLDALKELI